MDMKYAIVMELGVPYGRDTIKLILDKAAELGFVYYPLVHEKSELVNPLSIEMATESMFIEKQGDSDEKYSITFRFEDTHAILRFINYGRHTRIMFKGLSPDWSKAYSVHDTDIDLGRYGKLMFDLAFDFKVIRMEMDEESCFDAHGTNPKTIQHKL